MKKNSGRKFKMNIEFKTTAPRRTGTIKYRYKKTGEIKYYPGYPSVMGIYFWYDKNNELVYIGTSINIRKKLDKYLSKYDQEWNRDRRPIYGWLYECNLTQELVRFDWVEYKSFDMMNDHEAEMIKHYQPKLNATLDGKGGRPYFQTTQERRKEHGY